MNYIKAKSTPIEKWVNCELQITIFTENGKDINYYSKCDEECFYEV